MFAFPYHHTSRGRTGPRNSTCECILTFVSSSHPKRHGMRSRADLPDAGEGAHVNTPVFLGALGLDDVEALRVGADLGRVKRLLHLLHQRCLVNALRGNCHTHVRSEPCEASF
jgi:hypothetical protein